MRILRSQILKITICCCVCWLGLVQVQAQDRLQNRLDFTVEQVSIPDALRLLAERTDLQFAFSDRFFSGQSPVTLRLENHTIQSILDAIIQQASVRYELIGDQIIFTRALKPKRYTISGYIEDSDTGERLVGASIFTADYSAGTHSNEYGFYSLTLPAGKVELNYSYLGSNLQKEELQLQAHRTHNVTLRPAVMLSEVIVTPGRQHQLPASNGELIDLQYIEDQPDLGGEADLLRASQLSPGVQAGADGLGGLHVRGGNADQNLMLLDGVPVYNSDHLLSLFSIFNPRALRSARLLKGGFPARYGGRLSSVFDVHTREGNRREWTGQASLGLLSGNAIVEGPLANKRGSILLSYRQTHSDFLLNDINRRAFLNGQDGELSYGFFDFNGKVSYAFSQKDRLYLSAYYGGDSFENSREQIDDSEFESELTWGNLITALRWNHLFNDRLFSNTILTYSQYQFDNVNFEEFYSDPDLVEEDEFFFLGYSTNIRDIALRTDFDFIPSPQHYWRFGAGLTLHEFEVGAAFFDQDSELELLDEDISLASLSDALEAPQIAALEAFVYVEDEWRFAPRWQLNPGLRLSTFGPENGGAYVFLEPRLSLIHQLADQWQVRADLSRMVQYLHRVGNSGLSTPDDLWVPATDELRPQDGWQFGLGVNYLSPQQLEFSAETYYKTMGNILTFMDNIQSIEDEDDLERELVSGQGRAFGMELQLKKLIGRTGVVMNYTLSQSLRDFAKLNLGEQFAYRYDRRHQINLQLFHRINDRLQVSTSWVYGSAQPQLVVWNNELINTFNQVDVTDPGDKNEKRSNAYHRLDLNLKYLLPGKNIQHHFKLGVYNLYNRRNTAFYQLDFDDDEVIDLRPIHLLPILPSFSYEIQF